MVIRDFQNGNKSDLATVSLFDRCAMLRRESCSGHHRNNRERAPERQSDRACNLFNVTGNVRQSAASELTKRGSKVMNCQLK